MESLVAVGKVCVDLSVKIPGLIYVEIYFFNID